VNTRSESGRMVDVGLNACCAGTTGDDERQVCCIAQEGRVVSAREAERQKPAIRDIRVLLVGLGINTVVKQAWSRGLVPVRAQHHCGAPGPCPCR